MLGVMLTEFKKKIRKSKLKHKRGDKLHIVRDRMNFSTSSFVLFTHHTGSETKFSARPVTVSARRALIHRVCNLRMSAV